MIEITLNGKKTELNSDLSVQNLIDNLGIDTKKVAIECNLEIVPRSEYMSIIVENGDKLEIVHFIGGG